MQDLERRMAIGHQVQDEREHVGWSQAALARNAEVSENTISSIENGTHRTQPEKLRKVLDVLGLAPEGTSSFLNMEDVPMDVQLFLTVVAQRLTRLDEGHRTRFLARVYPMLLVEENDARPPE